MKVKLANVNEDKPKTYILSEVPPGVYRVITTEATSRLYKWDIVLVLCFDLLILDRPELGILAKADFNNTKVERIKGVVSIEVAND